MIKINISRIKSSISTFSMILQVRTLSPSSILELFQVDCNLVHKNVLDVFVMVEISDVQEFLESFKFHYVLSISDCDE